MKILLTGSTSFTGFHIALALADHLDWKIVCPTRNLNPTPGTPAASRIEQFKPRNNIILCPFEGMETPSLLDIVKEWKPTVFINHGFYMNDYRLPIYRVEEAFRVCVSPLQTITKTLQSNGCRLVVHSGTIFEPGEGGGDKCANVGESPYGVAKGIASMWMRYLTAQAELSLIKIVIPNPIGVLENEDRLLPQFMKSWSKGKTPCLKEPGPIRDHLPARWLGKVYRKAIADHDTSAKRVDTTLRPSGFIGTTKDLIDWVRAELGTRWKMNLPLTLESAVATSQVPRINSMPCSELLRLEPQSMIQEFWTELANHYERQFR